MNWITKNNYTIKRKFNQINNNNIFKGKNNNVNQAFNGLDKAKKSLMNNNQINYNINSFNQDNGKNNYTSIYYQINGTEALEQQLKKGEKLVQSNLNTKYILSELIEF